MNITKHELHTALTLERQQLIELVNTATEQELDQPSLCQRWSNRNVLGHILGYELSFGDALKLVLKKESLDSINERQAHKYEACSASEYADLLRKGHKRTLNLLRLTPGFLLNKKFIPVPNGRISLAQIFGDIAMDRAVHFLDIAYPLKLASKIDNPQILSVSLKFMLKSVNLLNSSIPQKFHGHYASLELTGLCGGSYSWELGGDNIVADHTTEPSVISVQGDANDFLFTLVGRGSLISKPLKISGNPELEQIFKDSLTVNKLWGN